MTTGEGEYRKGRVDATLDEHTAHLQKINGSIERFAVAVEALTLQIQRLGDAAGADRRMVITTAAALKQADEARRDRGDSRWSPVQKVVVVVSGLAAAVGTVVAVLHRLGHLSRARTRGARGADLRGRRTFASIWARPGKRGVRGCSRPFYAGSAAPVVGEFGGAAPWVVLEIGRVAAGLLVNVGSGLVFGVEAESYAVGGVSVGAVSPA